MSELEALDTVALLQDEVARLEEELRLRDEALASSPSAPDPAERDGRLQEAQQRVQGLTAELSKRDETIDLLWDQVRRLEESQAALLADWQDVEKWVGQLEQREADEPPRPPANDPPGEAPEPAETSPARPPPSEEVEDLRQRLRQAETELNAREAEFAAFRERTNLEIEGYRHEIEELKRRLETVASGQGGQPPELSPDERIRALRRHLMDVHIQECEERRSRSLLARLSKLLQHTAI